MLIENGLSTGGHPMMSSLVEWLFVLGLLDPYIMGRGFWLNNVKFVLHPHRERIYLALLGDCVSEYIKLLKSHKKNNSSFFRKQKKLCCRIVQTIQLAFVYEIASRYAIYSNCITRCARSIKEMPSMTFIIHKKIWTRWKTG